MYSQIQTRFLRARRVAVRAERRRLNGVSVEGQYNCAVRPGNPTLVSGKDEGELAYTHSAHAVRIGSCASTAYIHIYTQTFFVFCFAKIWFYSQIQIHFLRAHKVAVRAERRRLYGVSVEGQYNIGVRPGNPTLVAGKDKREWAYTHT